MSKIDGKRRRKDEENGRKKDSKKRRNEIMEVSPEFFQPMMEEKNVEHSESQRLKSEVPDKTEKVLWDGRQQEPDQLMKDINSGAINVYEESIFPVPSFGWDITAIVMISRGSVDIGKVFAIYPRHLTILVKPGEGERFVSIVLNRECQIQDKQVLIRLLTKEIMKMDQSVKDPDKKWSGKEDKLIVSGFTALPVKIFLETLALCFKNIEPAANGTEQVIKKGDVKIMATT